MPLHRTAPSDALTTFASDLLHDRGYFLVRGRHVAYLLGFPDGVDVSVDSLTAQRRVPGEGDEVCEVSDIRPDA
jgi:hypothetical protein